ncbi:hypothetical protein GCM10009559_81830 [Pseudonocardia zijingensis]|uniref:Mutator family transposase n=1 Tax=Pseudonocardia zijingensis TaxID=153376 RepID=A0ABN1NLG4_9PSEU
MAAPHDIEVTTLLEQHLAGASPDLLRQIGSLANAMMSAQADQVCGAGWGERSDERTNRRNGYRMREWDTRAGTVELAVPKLREGSYFPDWLLTHRRRAEQALVTVVATAYLLGVSTRRVERLAEQLGSSRCPARRSRRWPATSTPKSARFASVPSIKGRTRSSGSTPSLSRSARTAVWSTCTPWSPPA